MTQIEVNKWWTEIMKPKFLHLFYDAYILQKLQIYTYDDALQ